MNLGCVLGKGGSVKGRSWLRGLLVAGALGVCPALAAAQQITVPHDTWRSTAPDGTSIDVTYFVAGFTAQETALINQAAAAWSSPATGAAVNLVSGGVGSNITLINSVVSVSGNSTTGILGNYLDGDPYRHIFGSISIFNSLSPWQYDSDPNNPMPVGMLDFYSTILREFGEALGLGFANLSDPNSVMDANLILGEAHRVLSPGDIAALTHLYGAPEPATFALFGLGLFGVGLTRRTRVDRRA